MSRQNSLVALLDPSYHTFDFVTQNSPILLTAILTVAAKFVTASNGDDLYGNCVSIMRTLIGDGMLRNVPSVGLVQALSLVRPSVCVTDLPSCLTGR